MIEFTFSIIWRPSKWMWSIGWWDGRGYGWVDAGPVYLAVHFD